MNDDIATIRWALDCMSPKLTSLAMTGLDIVNCGECSRCIGREALDSLAARLADVERERDEWIAAHQ